MNSEHLIDGVSVPIVVWKDKNLNPTEKIIITDIIGLVKKGRCFKGNQGFADLVGLSKDRMSKILSDLSKRGYIKVTFERKSSSNVDKRIISLSPKFRASLLGGLAFDGGIIDEEMPEDEGGGIVTGNGGYSCQQLGGIVTGNYDKKSIEEVKEEFLNINEESVDSSENSDNTLFGEIPIPKSKKEKKEKVAAHPAYTPIVKFFCEEYWPDYKFFGARDGKQVKEIISQIERMLSRHGEDAGPDRVLEFFKAVITNAPSFYQKKSLPIINSKFSEIVEEIKKERNGQKTSKNANPYLQSAAW